MEVLQQLCNIGGVRREAWETQHQVTVRDGISGEEILFEELEFMRHVERDGVGLRLSAYLFVEEAFHLNSIIASESSRKFYDAPLILQVQVGDSSLSILFAHLLFLFLLLSVNLLEHLPLQISSLLFSHLHVPHQDGHAVD